MGLTKILVNSLRAVTHGQATCVKSDEESERELGPKQEALMLSAPPKKVKQTTLLFVKKQNFSCNVTESMIT